MEFLLNNEQGRALALLQTEEKLELRQLRLHMALLEKNGYLDGWEYDRLVNALRRLNIFALRAA